MTRLMLLRRSIRQGRLVGALLALVAGVTAAFLVLAPRLESVAVDRALGDAVAAAPAQGREVGLAMTPHPVGAPTVSDTPLPGVRAPFDRVDEAVRDVMGASVLRLLGMPTYAAQSQSLDVTREGGAAVTPDGVRAVLRVQSGLAEHLRWVTGTAPGAPSAERTLSTPVGEHTVRVVPVAVADTTARAWGLAVGDELDLTPVSGGPPAAAVLVGTYSPLDPADGFWQVEPRMTGLARIPTAMGGVVQEGALLAAPSSYGAVSDALWRTPPGADPGTGSPALTHTWRYPLDPGRLTAADVAPLRALLVRLDTDVRLRTVLPQAPHVTTGLAGILDGYDHSVRTTAVMTSFATAGVAGLAVLVLVLTSVIGVARRGAEIRMLRARGGSGALVAGLLGVEVALLVLPVGVVSVLLVQSFAPGATSRAVLAQTAAVLLVPVLAVVLAAAARVRAVDRPVAADPDTGGVVRLVRRAVLELAVLAVAVLAVTTVRSRGEVIAAGSTDWYAALAPSLVALAAALVLVRVVPGPLRWLARRAGTGRGLVGFVGLARAARTGASAVLPVAAVVVGATVLALLATTSAILGDQQEVAAYRAVGADVRVDALRVDAPDVAALAARPGVHAVVRAHTDPSATLRTADRTTSIVLLGVDPAAYAEVVRGSPLAFTAAEPAEGAQAPPPAVVSDSLAVGGVVELGLRGGLRLPVRVVGSAPGLERVVSGRETPVVVVPLAALEADVPAAQPNTAYLAADADAAGSLAATPLDGVIPSGLATGVATADGFVRHVTDLALPSLVTTTYLLGAVIAALLTLLAVLLVLAATHDERTTLVVRLRTLGLPHGRERGLAWVEVLPVVGLAALVGGLVGALAPWVVGAALDLAPFTGAVSRPPVDPRPVLALAAAAGVLLLGAIALLLDALAARRGRLADHLRRGATA